MFFLSVDPGYIILKIDNLANSKALSLFFTGTELSFTEGIPTRLAAYTIEESKIGVPLVLQIH